MSKTPPYDTDIDDFDHIWPLDVMMTHQGQLVCSGFDGIILEITGSNSSLENLWSDIYDIAESLKIPNKQYRTDVLENAQNRIEQLTEIGYFE